VSVRGRAGDTAFIDSSSGIGMESVVARAVVEMLTVVAKLRLAGPGLVLDLDAAQAPIPVFEEGGD
jgi:hypothetical protein